MVRHSLDLDLRSPEMQEARARLAAKHAPTDDPDFNRRLAEARARVAPEVPIAYRFIPVAGKFVIQAVTESELGIENEK